MEKFQPKTFSESLYSGNRLQFFSNSGHSPARILNHLLSSKDDVHHDRFSSFQTPEDSVDSEGQNLSNWPNFFSDFRISESLRNREACPLKRATHTAFRRFMRIHQNLLQAVYSKLCCNSINCQFCGLQWEPHYHTKSIADLISLNEILVLDSEWDS